LSNVNEFSSQLIQLFREEALDLLDQWENSCLSLKANPEKSAWDQLFSSVHSLKGSVQTLGLRRFAEYLSIVEDYLSKNTADTVEDEHIQALLHAQTSATEWVKVIETVEDSEIDNALQLIKDQLDSESKRSRRSHKKVIPERVVNKARHRQTALDPGLTKLDISEDVRVSGKLVDRFLDQLNEIQTHQNILENHFQRGDVSKSLANQSLSLSKKRIHELRRQVMELRSINAEIIFKRLKRTVIEANLALGKNVQLKAEGQLIKLDKLIADQIVAPLIHIVRNCVDHGIESSEVRLSKKKEANGSIRVALRRNVKNIEITIHDDGRGLDAETIFNKALKMGIIKSIPSEINDEFLLQVICTPGFSTSASVNEISGRGVGMNAVAEKIISIGGSLTLVNIKDAGTKFIINVPNSFTSIKAIVVKISDYKIAIPMSEVHEVFTFNRNSIETTLGEMKLEYKRDIIQYVSLANILAADKQECVLKNEVFGLISGKGHLKSIYGVDSIIGQQEVVVRPLEKSLTSLPGCHGAAYFSDGSPGLVISLNRLKLGDNSELHH